MSQMKEQASCKYSIIVGYDSDPYTNLQRTIKDFFRKHISPNATRKCFGMLIGKLIATKQYSRVFQNIVSFLCNRPGNVDLLNFSTAAISQQ